jgi:hypothetical protein
MHGQRLWGPPLDTAEAVVGWLGAMQAQEYAFARWSVAQRANGVTEADVRRAYAEGSILRTHVLRPTWHFALPADIRWLLRVTAPRVHALNAHSYRRLELDERLLTRTNRVVAKALEHGRHLTRRELAAVLDRAGVTASGPRLGYIMMRAELDAVVCSGTPNGKQHTYALLDERAPGAAALDEDQALAELTRRYFTSRGPATLKDYVRWSSLTVAQGRKGLDMVEGELEHETVDDRTYWFETDAAGRTTRSKVDLVQAYDEVIMSYSESRDLLLGLVEGRRVVWDDRLFHIILLDGHVIGHWRPVVDRDVVRVELAPARKLARAEEHALEAAVQRYGAFIGLPARAAPSARPGV